MQIQERHLGGQDASRNEKKSKKRCSSSSSSSSSTSRAASQHRSRAKKAGAVKDAFVEEISKLRTELLRNQQAAPSTPRRKTVAREDIQWTPKAHARLGSFCSFVDGDEVTQLLDPGKIKSWADIQDQPQTHSAGKLKKYLATRVPAAQVPKSKPAIINAILDAVASAFHG